MTRSLDQMTAIRHYGTTIAQSFDDKMLINLTDLVNVVKVLMSFTTIVWARLDEKQRCRYLCGYNFGTSNNSKHLATYFDYGPAKDVVNV